MAGTQHFHRMRYNVRRGLRETVASRQTLPEAEWAAVLEMFQSKCAYCDQPALSNRGIVPDHLVPANERIANERNTDLSVNASSADDPVPEW